MFIIERSPPTTITSTVTTDPIHLFTQFYIDKNEEHANEIKFALKKNVENPYIDSIILLNERIYTDEELGIQHDKIKQVNIQSWVTYADFLKYDVQGYKILANADIFLDESIQHVKQSDIHLHKKMYSLVRYEYNDGNPHLCYGNKISTNIRSDSQDTWIIHSNHPFTKKQLSIFNIKLGTPGCDNKINYLFTITGYNIYNDPLFIKTFHCHRNQERNYTQPKVVHPYMFIIPAKIDTIYPLNPTTVTTTMIDTYSFQQCNGQLYEYIKNTTKPFIIPRIAGVENNFATTSDYSMLQKMCPTMKKNAGIQFESKDSVDVYKIWYTSAFEKCDICASWEPWGNVYKYISKSQDTILATYKKQTISALAFDIFHYIYTKPWTHALANKRILVISAFIESIQLQPSNVYPVALFPGCTFVYLKPPQTNGMNKSRDWFIEFDQFCEKIKAIQDTFDIALCSCGGYGNPVCSYIYSLGKSAIYVGGVLQMYFGIYGKRWLNERKEIMTLFMTLNWKRPSDNEKPSQFNTIESGCYW
jgi:hypothetical protein